MGSISGRIKLFTDETNVSINQFEKSIGASNGLIGKAIRDNRDVGSSYVEKIILAYPDLNGDWLITGRGQMLKPKISNEKSYLNDTPVRVLNEPNTGIITVVVDPQGNSLVPVINAKAAAGLPQGLNEREYWSSVPSVTMPFPWFKSGDYILIQVKGESMHPTIYDGDWTFCRKLNDHKDIKDGYIHIIVTDDSVLCKRVLNRIEVRGVLALQSDNEAYVTRQIPIEEVRSIYKVEMKLSAILKNEAADLRKTLNNVQSEIFEMKIDLDKLLGKK